MSRADQDDIGGRVLAARSAGAPLTFTQTFDFTGMLPVNFFDLPLFQCEADGFPTAITNMRVFFANPLAAGVWKVGLRIDGQLPQGARDAHLNTGDVSSVLDYPSNGFLGPGGQADVSDTYYRARPGVLIALRFEALIAPHLSQPLNPAGSVFLRGYRLT